MTSDGNAKEQDVRRKYNEEKQEAHALGRENSRIRWESQVYAMRGQFSMKLKSHVNRELQKLRHRLVVESKK